MDLAMIHMMCGDYESAVGTFHEAEELAEALWTKSITQEGTSLTWNDYTKPYAGEDFERVMINLFAAISYFQMEQYESAVVECRRMNSLLSVYNDKYETKNVYKEDAFARYLSGIFYEHAGEPDSAFIDYYNAFKVFGDYEENYGTPAPRILLDDLYRVGKQVGRLDDLAALDLQPEYDSLKNPADTQNMGKVVFVHFMGHAPEKIEDEIVIPTSGGPVKMAFPNYAPSSTDCGPSRFFLESVDASVTVEPHVVQDINRIAVKNLDDRKSRIIARSIVRTAAKQGLIHYASEEAGSAGSLVSVGLNIANNFVERADIRCWRTLPGEIHLGRVFVAPGEYQVFADVCNQGKVERELIKVGAGQTVFVLCMTKDRKIIM